jgi:glutaredoxin
MAAARRPTLRSLAGLLALVVTFWGGSALLGRWQDARLAQRIQAHSQRIDITLYTTSTCPHCARAMAWLQRHGVRWQACNVETTARCQRDYVEQGSPGVPLVRVGDRWNLGFHLPWLAEALAAQDGSATPVTRHLPAQSANKPSGASAPLP